MIELSILYVYNKDWKLLGFLSGVIVMNVYCSASKPMSYFALLFETFHIQKLSHLDQTLTAHDMVEGITIS